MLRLFAILLTLLIPAHTVATAMDMPGDAALWYRQAPRVPQVDLYFFWSERCPHCLQARPHIAALAENHPWLRVHSLEVYHQPHNRKRFLAMAQLSGGSANSVPSFFWCGRQSTGWNGGQTQQAILGGLADCYHTVYGDWPPGFQAQEGAGGQLSSPGQRLDVPLFGPVEAQALSLPLLTVLLAGLDAFNPCAFFVLLFLLSLLVNTRSRARMLAVGGIFVLFSGLVYFLFMAAWLNLFALLGELKLVTGLAGLVAVGLALINIKDYFRPLHGPSLSMSAQHRGRLFQRVRGLVHTEHLASMLFGTVLLAVAANSYELLCTAGFPMIYTRLLTLHQLPAGSHYAYLALYNLVYVTPLLLIVLAFAFTLGRRKLSQREGRLLKLLSGLLMLGLGLLLVFSPHSLGNLAVAFALFGGAIALAWSIHRLEGQRRRPQ